MATHWQFIGDAMATRWRLEIAWQHIEKSLTIQWPLVGDSMETHWQLVGV